ncbi:unnamed protein product [Ectocarpus sp. CCAP 1310/34]|nr:unnamed protein product [Ectocarpus sp. CCAP 1310/34]
MVGVMDARSVLKAARLFGLCNLLGQSGGVFAGSHEPDHDHRGLQTSSNIVFIEAVVGTAFTTDEESGLQLKNAERGVAGNAATTITTSATAQGPR